MTGPEQSLERFEVLRLARAALNADGWLVGGAVRDLLLDRALEDVDFAVAGDAEAAARRLAGAAGAHVFPLSEQFGAWRVISPQRTWQADVTPLRGGTIESDLVLRDFTVNAMAMSLTPPAALEDPHGGAADLERRVLRAVSEQSFADDPLRTMRLARLACELALEPEPQTLELATAQAPSLARVAPERCFYELRRLICSQDPLRGIDLLDRIGVQRALLPELEALKDVEQNPYHHLDVWGHTLEVLGQLVAMERDGFSIFGEHAAAVREQLDQPLADELSRGQALRLAALFHDVGKPATRAVSPEGRVLFWGHDEVGATITEGVGRRLRVSTALAHFLALIARHHLRLGFLVHQHPLSRRQVYRYMRACEPVELEVTVLSAADRLATRGERTKPDALEKHLELARELAGHAIAWRSEAPRSPPVRGDELMAELGLPPGPELGQILERLREAAFAGEIRSRDEALQLARAEAAGAGGRSSE